MLNPIKKSFAYGDHTVTLETAEIARQAGGAVLVTMDDTVVLATVVGALNAKPGQDFFPLTVDYQERSYAAGRIPGGFFKREGRPSEKEILTCRLIDRPLRPLFPDAFYNEVQVVCTVMSCNPEIDPAGYRAASVGTIRAQYLPGLVRALRHELGVSVLIRQVDYFPPYESAFEELGNLLLREPRVERVLDAVELAFRQIERLGLLGKLTEQGQSIG